MCKMYKYDRTKIAKRLSAEQPTSTVYRMMSALGLDFPSHGLSFNLHIDESVAPVANEILNSLGELEVVAYHAKRDGQVLFIPIEELSNCPIEHPQTRGNAGEVLVFPGDSTGTGREQLAHLIIVYGPDNVFVEPLDRGFKERSYGLVGRLDQLDRLRDLGDSMWRHGMEKAKIRQK